MNCTICGEKIKATDREAIHFEIFSINGFDQNCGNICGDCVQAESNGFFKLWRKAENSNDDQ